MSASLADPSVLAAIPPSLLKTIPAASPPPGIQADFNDPPTRVPVVLGVGIVFFFLALVCLATRIYAKIAIIKKWQWDDFTISLGFACSIVYFGMVIDGCVHGATGKHQWDLHLDTILNHATMRQSYVATVMVAPALGLIKCSLFVQFYFLFRPLRWIRICVWIGVSVAATFYITVTIAGLVLSTPWGGENWIADILSHHYWLYEKFAIPTGVIGMIADWYLLILPIPAVWGLQMSTRKKIGILMVFMTGTLGALASIVSLYYRVLIERNSSDPTWKVAYVLLWSLIEMFCGVAAASMPAVSLFFQRQTFKVPFVPGFSALKSSLESRSFIHTRDSSQTKSWSNYSGWRESRGNTTPPSDEESKGSLKMHDLENGEYEARAVKMLRPLSLPPLPSVQLTDTQIHLTRDVQVTRGPVGNHPPFNRPSVY